VLEDCDLHDLGYTWTLLLGETTTMMQPITFEKVANNTWRCNFPLVRVTIGDPRHSNHRLIIVNVGERYDRSFARRGEAGMGHCGWPVLCEEGTGVYY
jgi:hypothetical protein